MNLKMKFLYLLTDLFKAETRSEKGKYPPENGSAQAVGNSLKKVFTDLELIASDILSRTKQSVCSKWKT